jgi:hypothetical protein
MLDSSVLDVAIGVALVYLLISLLCSAVAEVIAARLRLRSKDLEDGIRQMLSPGAAQTRAGNWFKRTWEFWRPLIANIVRLPWHLITGSPNGSGKPERGLAGALFDHPLLWGLKHNGKLPSYIPSRVFSAALLDTLNASNQIDTMRSQVASTTAGELKDFLDALFTPRNAHAVTTWLTDYASRIPDQAIAQGLTTVLSRNNLQAIVDYANGLSESQIKQTILAATDDATVENLISRSDALPEPLRSEAKKWLGSWDDALRAVLSLTSGVAEKVDDQRKEVERWFDQSMDRVSGWYKRRIQIILIVIAVPIVVALNADTLTMAQTLWQDGAVRDSLVNEASDIVNQASTPSCFVPSASTTPAVSGTSAATTPQDCADQIRTRLKGLQILGWRENDYKLPVAEQHSDPREFPRFEGVFDRDTAYGDWALKFGGLLITIGAVSQGATFWFDLLKRFVNLRGSGAPPKTSEGPR